MADEKVLVPVWELATGAIEIPGLLDAEDMSQQRLSELRTVLAAFADSPLATLQMHRIERRRDSEGGIVLHASSPLATQLAQLVSRTVATAPSKVDIDTSGEVLYRMVVPAKFASQLGRGLVKPMSSRAVPNGVYSGLRDSTGLVANATFVPVAGGVGAAKIGAVGAGTAGVGAAGAGAAGALAIAAPLVLMAVAVGTSAHADQQRQKATERITELLEQAQNQRLERDRHRLDGCRDAIDKATSVLLDQGKVGQSLGLDSASHEISTAISATRSKVQTWENKLTGLAEGPVDMTTLSELFPGIFDGDGAFHAHLETARLAIALKRRVLVLQAVEHAQLDTTDNPFRTFVGELRGDEQRLIDLETRIDRVLLKLSEIELRRPSGFLGNLLFSPSEVDRLLAAAYKLREYRDQTGPRRPATDIQVDIERRADGSIVVFPATEIDA